MPGKVRAQSPEVIAYADEHKIDITMLNGSGPQNAVTHDDVFQARVALQMDLPVNASAAEVLAVATHIGAQTRRRKEASERAEAEARARPALAPAPSAGASSARQAVASRGPAFALNPLVDQVRAQMSARNQAAPSAPPPSLFASGDTCSFTASGIPADAVLQVPWQARHALAAAPTTAEAYRIVDECTAGRDGATGEETAESLYDIHPGNVDYAARVTKWQQDSITPEQEEAAFQAMPWGNETFGELESRVTGGND